MMGVKGGRAARWLPLPWAWIITASSSNLSWPFPLYPPLPLSVPSLLIYLLSTLPDLFISSCFSLTSSHSLSSSPSLNHHLNHSLIFTIFINDECISFCHLFTSLIPSRCVHLGSLFYKVVYIRMDFFRLFLQLGGMNSCNPIHFPLSDLVRQ